MKNASGKGWRRARQTKTARILGRGMPARRARRAAEIRACSEPGRRGRQSRWAARRRQALWPGEDLQRRRPPGFAPEFAPSAHLPRPLADLEQAFRPAACSNPPSRRTPERKETPHESGFIDAADAAGRGGRLGLGLAGHRGPLDGRWRAALAAHGMGALLGLMAGAGALVLGGACLMPGPAHPGLAAAGALLLGACGGALLLHDRKAAANGRPAPALRPALPRPEAAIRAWRRREKARQKRMERKRKPEKPRHSPCALPAPAPGLLHAKPSQTRGCCLGSRSPPRCAPFAKAAARPFTHGGGSGLRGRRRWACLSAAFLN